MNFAFRFFVLMREFPFNPEQQFARSVFSVTQSIAPKILGVAAESKLTYTLGVQKGIAYTAEVRPAPEVERECM